MQSMICATAQADIGVLVTSGRIDEFEAGFEKSSLTIEHALILFSCGIKNLVVVVNKIDETYCSSDEHRFKNILNRILPYLIRIGFNEQKIQIIPVSALTGENLTTVIS